MKVYLIIYPHCYTYVNEKTMFVYNPQNKEYAYLDSIPKEYNISRDNTSLLIDSNSDKNLLAFSSQCIKKDLGYFYKNSSETFPINRTYNIRLVSSIDKIRKALGYNNGFSILNHITSIHIHSSNTFLHLNHDNLYQQVCYPAVNKTCMVSLEDISKYKFPNLIEVIISGDFNYSAIKDFANYYSNCSIIIRTVICERDIAKIKELNKEHKNVHFEFLITLFDEIRLAEQCFYPTYDNITLSFLITSIKDISILKCETLPSHYTPLLYTNNSKDLINEMLMTQTEILRSSISLDKIYERELIHSNYYGHICILANGDITIANNYICNILWDNVLVEFTNWINKSDNPWFLTRNKTKECVGCPLIALCPPLTIYEQLGYISKVCKGNVSL